jgi:hypothetical protein
MWSWLSVWRLKLRAHYKRTGHSANFCPIACKQRVESIITAADSLVRRHLTIWLDAMFQAEQLPARVADLNTWLTKT